MPRKQKAGDPRDEVPGVAPPQLLLSQHLQLLLGTIDLASGLGFSFLCNLNLALRPLVISLRRPTEKGVLLRRAARKGVTRSWVWRML